MMFWQVVFLLCSGLFILGQVTALYRMFYPTAQPPVEENPLYHPMDTVRIQPITRGPMLSEIHPRRSQLEPTTVMFHYRDPIARRIRRCKDDDCA